MDLATVFSSGLRSSMCFPLIRSVHCFWYFYLVDLITTSSLLPLGRLLYILQDKRFVFSSPLELFFPYLTIEEWIEQDVHIVYYVIMFVGYLLCCSSILTSLLPLIFLSSFYLPIFFFLSASFSFFSPLLSIVIQGMDCIVCIASRYPMLTLLFTQRAMLKARMIDRSLFSI